MMPANLKTPGPGGSGDAGAAESVMRHADISEFEGAINSG
jgi:hypothetical protein